MLAPLRSLLALVIGLATCVLLPLTLVAAWADDLVTDTDAYVATVAPLAHDPAVQEVAEQQIREATLSRLDPRVEALLGDKAKAAVATFAHEVVRSPAFDAAWKAANERAHRRLHDALAGTGPAQDVTIPLSAVVDAVTKKLAQQGVRLNAEIPNGEAAMTLLPARDLGAARTAYDRLTQANTWLPFATGAAALLTLVVARRRTGALAWLAAGCATGGLAIPVLLKVVRDSMVATAPSVTPKELRLALWDALVADLGHTGLVAAGVAGAVAVLAALASLVVRRGSRAR